MSIIKRVSVSLYSRIDKLVGQFENHDAVIETAIRESSQALAKAKVRLERVRQDGERLERELAGLQSEAEAWKERARQCAAEEETALECLRRRRECEARAGNLDGALKQHREAEVKLSREVKLAEQRLAEMKSRRLLFRTRESAADALRSSSPDRSDGALAVDVAFERWSERIMEAELAADVVEADDPLARRFTDTEERESLRAELKALLAKEEVDHER